LEICLNEKFKDDTYHITTGDLNGDGVLEIVEANSGTLNLIYRTIIK